MTGAADHLDGLLARDPLLYGRAINIVTAAMAAWNCTADDLLGSDQCPVLSKIRGVLTTALIEQTRLSPGDIAHIVARTDRASINSRIIKTRRELYRSDPVVRAAYYALIGQLRKRDLLGSHMAAMSHSAESSRFDLAEHRTPISGYSTPESIVEEIAVELGLPVHALMPKVGRGPNSLANDRAICYAIIRSKLKYSYPDIARVANKSAHSVIVTACHKLDMRCASDPDLFDRLHRCAQAVGTDAPTVLDAIHSQEAA